MTEEWRDVIGYEGLYQVSNFGNIKSLPRLEYAGRGYFRNKERIIKQHPISRSYLAVCLCKDGIKKTIRIHKIVYQSFKCLVIPEGFQIDHVDDDKQNNNLSNLQLLSNRENWVKGMEQFKKNRFMGVTWDKKMGKWRSQIYMNGRLKHLGYFKEEIEATVIYQNTRDLYGGITVRKLKRLRDE